MKTALLVIAQEVFRDEEYAKPKAALESLGIHVSTASVRPGPAIGKLGMRAYADLSLADASEMQWDAVAFIGGAGASIFFDDTLAHRLARDVLAAGKVVGAICIAPSILARAGLLDGVPATAYESQQRDLEAHGALWQAGPVVVSGRMVTANGPEAAKEFGERLGALVTAT